jgi:hypothetical protein
MKFQQLYLFLESEEVVEESLKNNLKLLAMAGILGISDYAYTIPKLREIVNNLVKREPDKVQNASKQADAKLTDPKTYAFYMQQLEEKPEAVNSPIAGIKQDSKGTTPLKPSTGKPDAPKKKETPSFLKTAIPYIERNENSNGVIRNSWYNDNKGYPTIGIGHLVIKDDFKDGTFKEGEYERDDKGGTKWLKISDKRAREIYISDLKEKLASLKRQFPEFDSYPDQLKVVMLDGFFRGDLAGSPTAKALIRTAGDYYIKGNKAKASRYIKEAAKNYLDSDEYETSKKKKSGIYKRMDHNADIMSRAFDEKQNFEFGKNLY